MTGTERKVLNKYYPPDFDPRKIPKCRVERNRQYVIRVMAPFNMRCNTCGEYIYKGKKFNARRETVEDSDYLGLSLFRFYIRCPGCLAEITFTTDLKNCDYAQEHGSTRLFEAEKLVQEQDREIQRQEAEDATNPMKMLEKRTKMSRFEMEALERLEELKEMNQRQAKPDYTSLIREITKEQQNALKRQEEEDEAFVQSVFGRKKGKTIKREKNDSDSEEEVEDDDNNDEEKEDFNNPRPSSSKEVLKQRDKPPLKKPKLLNQKALLSGIIVKGSKETTKKEDQPSNVPEKLVDIEKVPISNSVSKKFNEKTQSTSNVSNSLSLLGSYDGSSSDNADSD